MYTRIFKQKFGKVGILFALALSLVGLYFSYEKDLHIINFFTRTAKIENIEYILLVIGALLFTTFIHFSAKKLSQEDRYVSPVITSHAEVEANINLYGIDAIYLGSVSKLQKDKTFVDCYPDYIIAKNNISYYSKTINFEGNLLTSLKEPAKKVLVVKYKDGRYQFAQLKIRSTEMKEVLTFLESLVKHGLVVGGEYEEIKSLEPLFSSDKKMLVTMGVIAAVALLIILLSSVLIYFVG